MYGDTNNYNKVNYNNHIVVILISVIIAPFIYGISCILLKDDIALNVLEQLKSKFIKKNSS